MEPCIYHGIQVQVDSVDGESISQICRCTGSHSCHGGDQRNTWLCVKQCLGKCYVALNEHPLWPLQCIFQMKLRNGHGAFIEYWLALALTTIPEHSGNLHPVSKLVHECNPLAAVALLDFSM
jgi:hypothetical protein